MRHCVNTRSTERANHPESAGRPVRRGTASAWPCRRGSIALLAALMMVFVFAFVAFAVDTGYITAEKSRLQAAADAAALAGLQELPNLSEVVTVTDHYATINYQRPFSNLEIDAETGMWDRESRTFSPTTDPSLANAVQVTLKRNGMNLFFAPLIGTSHVNVQVSATAAHRNDDRPGTGIRFLIDEDMIDSDIPTIEQLADDEGVAREDLISDRDGDWFIDLPPGVSLELPTGQTGDEGLLDITANNGTWLPQFPFRHDTSPTLEDFLNYNEDSSTWRYDLIDKEDLDPLSGTGRWNDPDRYDELVDPDFVHVSPVYKSDVSALDSVGDPVWEGVNALGERRGLLAYKITAVGTDPDGSGSVLPGLVIEIVDPATTDLSTLRYLETTSGSGSQSIPGQLGE